MRFYELPRGDSEKKSEEHFDGSSLSKDEHIVINTHRIAAIESRRLVEV
jgi:hypothetical protein